MNNSLPSWFKDYLTRYKRTVALALGLGALASACAALLMFTAGYLISDTAIAGTTVFSIMVPVACVQLFGIGRPFAHYLERLSSHDWVLHVTSDLRLSLYLAISKQMGDPAQQRATGEYLGLLADDVAHLQNLYLRVVFPSAIAYLLALGAAVMFGFFSLPFALVVLMSFALIVAVLPICSLLATRALAQRAKAAKAAEYACLTDDVFGAVDWVLAGRGAQARENHARSDAAIRAEEANVRLIQRSVSFGAAVLLAALLCGVLVWAGYSFGTPGPHVNWIAAFALGFFPLLESFAVLPAAFSEWTAHRDSLGRLDDLLADADGGPVDEVLLAGATETNADAVAEAASTRVSEDELACDASAIELRDVTYAYPLAKRPALSGVSLKVEQGCSLAVLGRSGAGKSTMAQLVCGALTPDEGSVMLFGQNTACVSSLSGLVGFVGQTPYLFNRTLRDNLTMGVNPASDDSLVAVLRDVGLEEKLATLSDGLDTVIGETGTGFSGGEAHRVAIARVLVADTPIVVVDEPFSALDPETERGLLETLLNACTNRTLLVITHHLAQIDRFDRVVFVEDGRIDLDGAPAQLMETSPRFRTLVEFDR